MKSNNLTCTVCSPRPCESLRKNRGNRGKLLGDEILSCLYINRGHVNWCRPCTDHVKLNGLQYRRILQRMVVKEKLAKYHQLVRKAFATWSVV